MSEMGIVLNHRFQWAGRDELYRLGIHNNSTWVRSIVYNVDEFDNALDELPPGVKVAVMINNECDGVGWSFENWDGFMRDFARRFSGRVHAVECGNELDIWYDHGDRRLTPQFAGNLVRSASPHLRANGMLCMSTSVAGGRWFEYLEHMTPYLHGYADAVTFHPYGKRFNGVPRQNEEWGDFVESVRQVRDISGLPVAVTEYGVKIGEAGGEEGQKTYVKESINVIRNLPDDLLLFACYFAYSDGIGTEHEQGPNAFGLVRADGTKRPAYNEFARLLGGMEAPQHMPRFVLGFKDMHDAHPDLVGDALEDEYGPVHNVSMQRTTNGFLFWAAVQETGSVLLYVDLRDGARYVWDGSQLRESRA